MKTKALLFVTFLILVRTSFGASVSFDNFTSSTNNDLLSNFQFNSGLDYEQVTSGGITGGAVDVPFTNAANAVLSTESFSNLPGTFISASMVVKLGINSTSDPGKLVIELGIFGAQTSGKGEDHVGVGILATSGSNLAGWSNSRLGFNTDFVEGSAFAGTLGTWYRLTLGFANLGGNDIQLSGSIHSLGTSGTATPNLIRTWNRNYNNPSVGSDPEVHVAFFGQGIVGADLFDNFSAVPEPSAIALLLISGVTLFARRRKGLAPQGACEMSSHL
jgi:hypothetical protein